MYSQIPDRAQKLEDEKKKKTLVRKFKERNNVNDAALDVIEEKEGKQKRIPKMIEMNEERKEANGMANPNPQGGEELPSDLVEIGLEDGTLQGEGEMI
jgi:hypothetical protein